MRFKSLQVSKTIHSKILLNYPYTLNTTIYWEIQKTNAKYTNFLHEDGGVLKVISRYLKSESDIRLTYAALNVFTTE